MTTTESQKTVVVRPQGKIIAANAEEFRRELHRHIEAGNNHIIIDLGGVDLIDSKGLAVFIMCHQSLAARSGSLAVVTNNADFQELFRIMRLDRHFSVRSA